MRPHSTHRPPRQLVSSLTLGCALALSVQASAEDRKPAPAEAEQAAKAPSESAPQNGGEEKDQSALPPEQQSAPEKANGAAEERLEENHGRREKWREEHTSRSLPKRADVLALTVSGGVSLGSYEAGMLHTLTEALRRSPGSAQLRVVTGASAGSANALIAGTEACQSKIKLPEESLGYRVWVETGLPQLFDPKRVTSRSLFIRDGLDAGYTKMKEEWQKGLPSTCDFVFGAAVTREKGYEVDLAPGLVAPRQAERFVVRVEGQGGQRAPAFENYIDPAQSFERPLLPLTAGQDRSGEADANAIWQLISASAAFPVAFPAQPIEHCTTPRRGEHRDLDRTSPPHCAVATRVDSFVDGGVFDNNPLSTAYEVASKGLIKTDDKIEFRPVPEGGSNESPEVVFGYIDPDLRSYPIYQPPEESADSKRDPMLSILTRLGGQVLSSARGRELATFAERHPEALDRLWPVEGSYPPVSELVGAFFGFFEQDFRDFDFHLGSYDLFRDLRDKSGTMLGVEPFLDALELDLNGPIEKVPPRYQKLGCILAHAEPDRYSRLAPLCSGKELRNFRILLQVTLDRLWSNCRQLTERDAGSREHLQCKRARGDLPPPVVDTGFKVRRDRFKTADEQEFDYAMRLLDDYGFHFRDLGLSPHESEKGRVAIRRKLAEMVHAVSDAQPGFTNRTVVLTAGRMMVNRIAYEPPPRRWYFMVGSSISVGYLHQISEDQPFFFNPDIRQHALRTLITDRANEYAGAVSFGVEWALLPLSGSVLQSALGLRGGYQFAAQDNIGLEACDEEEAGGDSRGCSQPMLHIPFSLTALEHVRLSVTPIIYPMPQSWGHKPVDLEIALGGEFF
jgi:predicted acylesterase/phospholipase RssA